MSGFLILAGGAGWLLGGMMFMAAKGGIHEVAGLVAIGSGTLAIGLAGVIMRLDTLTIALKMSSGDSQANVR